MLNILSILFGAVALILALPALFPLLGWLNWFILPIGVIGLVLGVLSSRNLGRNLCIAALAVCTLRLLIGGGLI
jgi:hypothetical protein